MSLLTVVQTVCQEIGLTSPTTVIGNADNNVIQLAALANRAGKELAEDPSAAGYWQFLRKQYLFNLTFVGPYTGNTTANSNTITNLSSTTGILNNWIITGNGLLTDSLVTNVNAGAQTVTMNVNATSNTTGTTLYFGQELYPFPSDLAYFIVQTGWDRNFRWQLLGPLDAQEWQVIKSGISPVGPRIRFRVMGNQIAINPVPASTTFASNDLIVFEYVSNSWVAVTGAPTVGVQTSYLLDTDVSLVPEDLLIMSLKWRFLRSKGLSYDQEYTDFLDKLALYKSRSAMTRNLPLNARASGIRLLNSQNVPDTGFGS